MALRRLAAAAAVVVLAVAAGETLRQTGFGQRLELPTVDARFAVRGTQPAWPGVVVVGIDTPSLDALGRFPFPRRVEAQMIDRLREDGARVIAYDLVFDSASDPRDDLALFRAAERARERLVLAADATNAAGQTFVLGGVANQRTAGVSVGSVNYPDDRDGVVRRIPFTVEGLQNYAVAVVRAAGRPERRVRALFNAGPVLIDFPGPAGTVKTYSFIDVLRRRVPASAIRGRIVVVGATAADLQDYHPVGVSTSRPMSGPELEADAVATLMRGAPLRPVAPWLNTLILLLGAALAVLAGWRARARWVAVTAAVTLVALLVGAQLAFDAGRVITLVAPIGALLAGTVGTLGTLIWIERTEIRALRERFARADQQVVDAVLAQPARLRGRALAIGPESVIAGYRLERLQGHGGMGVVYAATQLKLQRTIALKLINPDRADDLQFRTQFVTESLRAAAFEHPHVIPVYDAGNDDGLLFIAMRLVTGPTLHDELAGAPLPAPLVCAMVAQVADALHHAHRAGLVHGDVKPANVLIDHRTGGAAPHCYLTDFGVSHDRRAAAEPAAGGWAGTSAYAAPEQRAGHAPGPPADIYSLGRILFQGLCGRLPRDGETAPSGVWPSVPPVLDAIVARALAVDPADRYPDAIDLAQALSEAVGGGRVELSPDPGAVTASIADPTQPPS